MTEVGERLRRFRAGTSINELSRAAGVSRGRISEIERGIANPSFETLWRLSKALSISISAFFAGPDPEVAMVVRKRERKRLVLPRDKLEYELLTPDLQRSLEVILLRAPPGFDNSHSPLTHDGEKCIYVVNGTLTMNVGGTEYELRAGDSITFDASIAHYAANRGKAVVQAYQVVTPPSF
jgi:transcriptional regulator with XRE-family HTH domain